MIKGPALTTEPFQQATLEWPGTDETCPKCHGQRHVYYLHAGQPGVEVVGGKRPASGRHRAADYQDAINQRPRLSTVADARPRAANIA